VTTRETREIERAADRPGARQPVRGIFASGGRVLRQAKLLIAIVAAAAVVLFNWSPVSDSLASELGQLAVLAVLLASAYASYRVLTTHVTGENHRASALMETARLEGVSLATATLRHHIANKLAVAVGYSEMLADDPRLPSELQVEANRIYSSAMAAADIIHRLHEQLSSVQIDMTVAGPSLLNVAASTAPHGTIATAEEGYPAEPDPGRLNLTGSWRIETR